MPRRRSNSPPKPPRRRYQRSKSPPRPPGSHAGRPEERTPYEKKREAYEWLPLQEGVRAERAVCEWLLQAEREAVKETSSSSLPKAQASEESALNALEDLLHTTTLDDSSSSMPKPKGSEDTEQAVKKTLSSSMPQAQASEDTDKAVKETSSSSMPKAQASEESELDAVKELFDTTTLDVSSYSSSMPKSKGRDEEVQPAPQQMVAEREANYSKTALETSSCSMPQSIAFKMPDLSALNLDINLLASSCVSTLTPTGLMIKYFVRVDNNGFHHTYPNLGRPFKSIEETQEAIDFHHAIQRKNLCMDGLSDEEQAVRCALYWYHNGTRKHSQQAFDACTTNLPTNELVKAVLDKYNEEYGLVGDFAYELEKIVSHDSCFDGKGCLYRSYSHFNLTMRTKGAEGNNKLYFAEVTCLDGDGEYEAFVLTSICVLKPDDNGECHACEADIKHPNHDGYNHGRPYVVRGGRSSHAYGVALFEELFAVHDEAWLKEEEARVRRTIKDGLAKVNNRRVQLFAVHDEAWLKEEEARVRRTIKDCLAKVNNRRDEHGKKNKYVIPAKRTIMG